MRAGFVKATKIKKLRYGKDREKYLQRSYQYVPKLRAFLKRLAHDRMAAHIEDIIQESLLAVYLAWARDRKPIANVWAFLRASSHRRLIDMRRLRDNLRTTTLSDIAFMSTGHSEDGIEETTEPDFPADELYDPAVYLEHIERLARAQKLWYYAARGLAPRTRKVVRLRMEGHTQKEIAKVLGIKENTVEVQLQNGYRSIRENWKRGSIDERLLLAG
jgi:RNA polymerase sigma factor (sigma-70 family)